MGLDRVVILMDHAQLGAYRFDMRIDGALQRVGRVGPDQIHQLRARKQLAGALKQGFQQQILIARQRQMLAVVQHAGLLLAVLEAQPLRGCGCGCRRGCSHGCRCGRRDGRLRLQAAQYRADARHQLAWRERLDHIIIGPDLQPDDAVDLVIARGQKYHRRIGELAQAAAHIKAAYIGQADIEHNQIGCGRIGGGEQIERALAQRHMLRREAVSGQRIRQRLRNRGFVFDNQDGGGHGRQAGGVGGRFREYHRAGRWCQSKSLNGKSPH
jgi:hypothetical protein